MNFYRFTYEITLKTFTAIREVLVREKDFHAAFLEAEKEMVRAFPEKEHHMSDCKLMPQRRY